MNTDANPNKIDAEFAELLDHLKRTCVLLEEFGCFVGLSPDNDTIFVCAVNSDGSPERDEDNPQSMNWVQVSAPESNFLAKVNRLFDKEFQMETFAGR